MTDHAVPCRKIMGRQVEICDTYTKHMSDLEACMRQESGDASYLNDI